MEEQQQQESSVTRSSEEEEEEEAAAEGGSSSNDAASVVRSCDVSSSSSSMSALYHGNNNRSTAEASEVGGGGQQRVPMIPPVAAIAFAISLQQFYAPVVFPEPNIEFFFRHYLDDIDDDNGEDDDDDDDNMDMEFINNDNEDIDDDDDDVSAASFRRLSGTLGIMELVAVRGSGRPFMTPPPEPSTNRQQQPHPPPRSGTPFQLFPVPPPFSDVDGVDDDLYAADWYYGAGNGNDTSEEEEGGANASPDHLLPAYQHVDRLEHRLDRLRSNDPGTGRLVLLMSDILAVYLDSRRTRGAQEWELPELPPPLPDNFSLEMGQWEPLGSMYGPRLWEGLRCNTTVTDVHLDWDTSAVVVARDDVRTRALHRQLSEMHNSNVSEISGDESSDVSSHDFLRRLGQMVSSLRNLRKLSIPSISSDVPDADGQARVEYTHGAARVLEGAAHGVPEIDLSLRSGARTRPSSEVLNRAPLRTEIATALARSHHSTLQVLDVHLGGNYHGEEAVGCFRAIFHVVPSLTSLVELSLENWVFHGDCSMTSTDLAACFQSKSLKSLVILDVQVSDDDLVEAAAQAGLANNAALEKFDLDFRSRPCSVTYDGVVRFVQGLAQNVTMKELVLPGRVPREAQKVLVKALQNVYALKSFTFRAEADPESDHAIKCLLAMNEAGRAYVKSQPTNLWGAIDVWQSVRDDLTSIFLHARENPLVFPSLGLGSSSNARTTAAVPHPA